MINLSHNVNDLLRKVLSKFKNFKIPNSKIRELLGSLFYAAYSPIIRSKAITKYFTYPIETSSSVIVSKNDDPEINYFQSLPTIIRCSGYFDPRFNAFYDESGKIIENSALRRGLALSNYNSPINIPAPKPLKAVNFEKGIFGGILFGYHYGHFLTESISRLWFIHHEANQKADSIPIFFRLAGDKINRLSDIFSPAKDVFNALGIYERIHIVNEPIFVKEMIIPSPSIINNNSIYEAYIQMCARIGSNIKQTHAQHNNCFKERIYLSRSKLSESDRKPANEKELEKKLLNLGYLIKYAEKMPFSEQIHLFSGASEIISPIGSAFHTLPLSGNSDIKLKYLIETYFYNNTHKLIDHAMNINSVDIRCIFRNPLTLKRPAFEDQVIDIERAMEGILNY